MAISIDRGDSAMTLILKKKGKFDIAGNRAGQISQETCLRKNCFFLVNQVSNQIKVCLLRQAQTITLTSQIHKHLVK